MIIDVLIQSWKMAIPIDGYYIRVSWLKEYYEIVGELRPLSGFFPKHADLFTEMHL